eukprot:3151909-Rhodomonas_salina.1
MISRGHSGRYAVATAIACASVGKTRRQSRPTDTKTRKRVDLDRLSEPHFVSDQRAPSLSPAHMLSISAELGLWRGKLCMLTSKCSKQKKKERGSGWDGQRERDAFSLEGEEGAREERRDPCQRSLDLLVPAPRLPTPHSTSVDQSTNRARSSGKRAQEGG